ncbi:hypothetical protein BX666DRAFT_1998137 [Dichotomocladium elegans]|nr:hypothetical protein BX666DRAFT_1998137 [Dichotomocladium elegans]
MRLTAILFALCAAAVATASPRTVRTDTVTTPANDGVVSTLASLAEPVGVVNIGQNSQTRTTTTTTRRRKVRRVFSNTQQQPPLNLERLATLSFAAAQGEGRQAENFVFKAAKQADQDLGMAKKPTMPQPATQPPNLPGQAPKPATVPVTASLERPHTNEPAYNYVAAA